MEKCVVCKQEVKYPKFDCPDQPGHHSLPSKTYYHPGGQSVQSLRDRRLFGPHMILVPSTRRLDNTTGNHVLVPGLEVNFVSGKYSTSDAEEQYYLDRKDGLCDEARWDVIYLLPEQQLEKQRGALEDVNRQIRESNELLAAAKAAKGK